MNFTTVTTLEQRKLADALVIPFYEGKKGAECAVKPGKIKEHFKNALDVGDFKGKEGEVLVLYGTTKLEKRIVLLGLGKKDKISIETLRRSFANIAKETQCKKLKKLSLAVPNIASLDEEAVIRGTVEGLLLVNYAFDQLKRDSIKDSPTVLLDKVTLIGGGKRALPTAKKYAAVFEGVYLARDLVNGNADDVTPQYLAHVAQTIAKKSPRLKATVFNKKRIEKEEMGLMLAVNRGSPREPAFIIVEYKGDPKSKDHTVIVGKGVVYDTGGLNLKPGASMDTMKCDMGGAATALGTVLAAEKAGLKKNLTVVVPSVENSISSKSYKPGDVYVGYSGKSVEIGNTDAEGRLILADALAYVSKKLKPTRIVDFATLTGAILVALGEEVSGLMANDDVLAAAIEKAGQETFDRVWRMPLYDEYKKLLKSDIADINNIGGRYAGSITAALFLQEFVGEGIPWAHIDIAGTAYLSKPNHYHPKNATGTGVRLMIEFLENL